MSYVNGCDISTWQDSDAINGHIDFAKMAEQASFVFVKASQATFTDADFERNWAGAKAAGMLRGAYHFFTWDKPATAQAVYFWERVKNDPGELPLVCDYEYRTGAPLAGTARNSLKTFLETLYTLSGRRPIIYTSPSFWNDFGSHDSYWMNYPLWIAHYTASGAPTVPAPWIRWTFWQYTDKGNGQALGVESKGVDMNRFNGTLDQLYRFAGKPENPAVTLEQKVNILWDAHPELH